VASCPQTSPVITAQLVWPAFQQRVSL